MTGVSLLGGPGMPLYEAVKVKHGLSWRPPRSWKCQNRGLSAEETYSLGVEPIREKEVRCH